MQKIPFPDKGVPCDRCENAMFISYTPEGAGYRTCPICGNGDSMIDYIEDDDSLFCDKCCILYKLTCTHGVNGCTDDAHYASLVNKFKFNDELHIGMPKFKSYKDYTENKDKYELFWICMCKGNCCDCVKAFYPKDKYPKYNISCSCSINSS